MTSQKNTSQHKQYLMMVTAEGLGYVFAAAQREHPGALVEVQSRMFDDDFDVVITPMKRAQ